MTDIRGASLTGELDERLLFFLENIDYLRTWAALDIEVSAMVVEQLESLGGDIQTGVVGIAPDVIVKDHLEGAPIALYRPAWTSPDGGDPDIAIRLGWDSAKVLPAGSWPRATRPYVGVKASRLTDRSRHIEKLVTPLAHQRLTKASGHAGKYLKGIEWVVYQYLVARDDWYRDISAWRSSVVKQVIDAWTDCAPLVDEAVSGVQG